MTTDKSAELFPGASKLVEGPVPSSSLLLLGPPGIGKTVFCKQFLGYGLSIGEPCVFIATDESPDDVKQSMKAFGFGEEKQEESGMFHVVDSYSSNPSDTNKSVKFFGFGGERQQKNRIFRIVDCYSWKLGVPSSGEYVVNNPADLAALSLAIDKALHGLRNVRLVLDSITGLTSISSHNVTYFSKFLQIIVAKIRSANGNAIFSANPEAHDKQFTSFLRLTFDGTLEMKQDELENEVRRQLRVVSIKGAKHKTCWMPFEITDKGINFENETTGLRCVMCKRLIESEPYFEVFGGKEYIFDSLDCARAYGRMKRLYGENFE